MGSEPRVLTEEEWEGIEANAQRFGSAQADHVADLVATIRAEREARQRAERERDEAREAMSRAGVLDAEESAALMDTIENPPPPTPALTEMMAAVTRQRWRNHPENRVAAAARVAALSEAAALCAYNGTGEWYEATLSCRASILARTTPDALAAHREREARRDAVIEAARRCAEYPGTVSDALVAAVEALEALDAGVGG